MTTAAEHLASLRRVLSERGVVSSRELQVALGASQATVSRALAQMGEELVTMGEARARRYALARAVPRVGHRVEVFSISPSGTPRREGTLQAITGSRYAFKPASGAGRVYESLPWFALDQRPEGFLGRALARAHPDEGLPPRLSDWNDDQVLYALTALGGSARGDLVFGAAMVEQAQRPARAPTVDREDRAMRYPRLADAAIAGDAPGSSAGGEQPKFEALRRDARSGVPVIVKFSPPLDTPAGARWKDLMLLEHLSNQVLRERGVPASVSEVMIAGNRAFLEVVRFDRSGDRGRLRTFSLGPIDDEFLGARQSWAASARQLARQRRLPEGDAAHVAFVEAFGLLIANADMHFGNLSFFAEGLEDPTFRLAPIYDMSPMRYVPTTEDPRPLPEYDVPPVPAPLIDAWPDAREAAIAYWERAEAHAELGEDLREAAGTIRSRIRGRAR